MTEVPAFELRGVVKRFGRSVEALRGVDVVGRRGEVLGLLGPNGAGKTTAVKCLAGLVRPDRGEALLGGRSARLPEARRSLGYLPERPRFNEVLTAAELLDREGRLLGLPRTERRARTAVLVDRVGLEDSVFRRRVATYSKGERARLGLALALLGEPQVVLLDEPTDGLDPLGRKAVRELLGSLRAEGRAVLLNSHLLREVEDTCDRVAVLRAGQVIAAGPTDALLGGRRLTYSLVLSEPPTPGVLSALEALSKDVSADGAELRVGLEDVSQVDALIDLLRGEDVGIRELRPRASLEDVFVELMSRGSAAAPEAAP